MTYKVKLKYFEDSATGNWGFTHYNTYNSIHPFNAFFSPEGIFHDVFEHYFEDEHKYFKDESACSIFGEMVASAHKYYFYNEIGFNSFIYRNHFNLTDFTVDTRDLIKEYFYEGYIQYPLDKINIPKQKKIEDFYFENIIDEFIEKLRRYKKEEGSSNKFSFSTIRHAYRLGYRMAEAKWGKKNYSEVYNFFSNFLSDWNKLTLSKNGEGFFIYTKEDEMKLDGIEFTVNTTKLTCKAHLLDKLGNKHSFSKLKKV